jgi:hypothetical protein
MGIFQGQSLLNCTLSYTLYFFIFISYFNFRASSASPISIYDILSGQFVPADVQLYSRSLDYVPCWIIQWSVAQNLFRLEPGEAVVQDKHVYYILLV